MMARTIAHMVIEIQNGRGIKALQRACEIAAEWKESQPWNAEAKQLVASLKVVAKELKPRPVKK